MGRKLFGVLFLVLEGKAPDTLDNYAIVRAETTSAALAAWRRAVDAAGLRVRLDSVTQFTARAERLHSEGALVDAPDVIEG